MLKKYTQTDRYGNMMSQEMDGKFLKKRILKDRHGNKMSFEFDIPKSNVPPVSAIPQYSARGGDLDDHPGSPKGTDTVPAWLTPGEFVVNKEATDIFGDVIEKMNNVGRKIQKQNGSAPDKMTNVAYAKTGMEILSRELLDENESFQEQLNKMLNKYEGSEFTKDKLYNIIDGESSFDPTVKNPKGSATGLFQFTDTAINDLKDQGKIDKDFTTSDIAAMSPTDQLKLYETYLDRWKYGGDAHLGIMQAAPGAYFKKFRSGDSKGNLNQEVFDEGSKSYRDNPGWTGDDGRMTFASISDYYDKKGRTDKLSDADMIAQRITPDTSTSGARMVTDASFVPPMNVGIPNERMLSMEPIEGARSGQIARYMAGIPRPSRPPVYNAQRMMDINNPLGTPVPVRDGVALTPEYLAALQDNDFAGMGSDSNMFKINQKAVVPPAADIYDSQRMIDINNPLGDPNVYDPQRMMDINNPLGESSVDNTDPYAGTLLSPDESVKNYLDLAKKEGADITADDLDFDAAEERIKAKEAEKAKRRAESKRMQEINRGFEDPTKLPDYLRGYAMEGKDNSGDVSTENQLATDDKGFDIKGFEPKENQNVSQQIQNVEAKDKTEDAVKAAEVVVESTKESEGPGPDQPGDSVDSDVVKKKGEEESDQNKKKAQGFLKGLFGNLFDKQELKRMAIMYLGSRLLGYDHDGSINYAVKQYLERVDAKEAARQTWATSAAATKTYTAKSLAKFMETGDYDDLEHLPAKLRQTGNTKKFYGINKQGKRITVVGQEFKVGTGENAETVYLDRNGTKINLFNFTENPQYVPKTKEYNEAMVKYQELFAKNIRDNQSNNIAAKKDGKNIYYDGMGVSGDAARIAKWALENKVDLGDMPSLINLAYNDLVEDAKGKEYKPSSLIPYLNSLKIRQGVKGLDFLSLLRTEPKSKEEKARGYGKVVNSKDFERLRQNAINFMKTQNPDFQSVTDDNIIATEWFRAATEDWAALPDDTKKQWQRKANKKESTGFFEWAKSQLRVSE